MPESSFGENTRDVKPQFPIRPGELLPLELVRENFGIGDRTLGKWKRAIWEAKRRDFARDMGTASKWVLSDDILFIFNLEELPDYAPEYKWRV